MTPIGLLVWSTLRRRWRTYAALAVLLGVVTGAAMAAAAGARRTGTSYERLLARTNGEDVLVNPDDGWADFEAITALPQVVDACQATGAPIALIGEDGGPSWDISYIPFLSDGRCLVDLSAPARVEGRLPDPDEPYEAFLSRRIADDLGLGPGDPLPVLVQVAEEAEPEVVELEITGTGIYGQDALLDPENEASFPVLLVTPAFGERHPVDPAVTFAGVLVQLEGGERDLAAFSAAAVTAAGELLHLEDRWGNERKAALALEPYELALWLFALVTVLGGGGILAGALHRAVTVVRADRAALGAIGLGRRDRRTVPVALAVLTGGGAALVATATAIAASPLFPIGPAREIEPDPGVAVDGTVLAVGAAACLLVALAVGAVAARSVERVPGATGERAGLLARLRLALPAPAAAGVRLAMGELGGSRSAARTTVAGAVLGVVGVLTVLGVGAGLNRLLDEPDRFGWSWDVLVAVSEEDSADYQRAGGGPVYRKAVAELEAQGITAHSAISYGQIELDGRGVAAIGLGRSGAEAVGPTLLEGRLPAADDEVALGSTNLRELGAAVGDVVEVRTGDRRRDLRVVGRATFPRLTEYPGAPNTGLGDGAVLTADALTDLTDARPYAALLVRGDDAAVERFRAGHPTGNVLDVEAPIILVDRPQRPDALFGYESTAAVRQVLTYLLVGVAAASLALGLGAGARAAQRDLAVLRTLGFTRRQAQQVLHVHGLVVAALALGIGVPVGIALGRAGWRAFADHLGVAPDPATPTAVVALIAASVLLISLLLTVPAAATLRRRSPAVALRAE